MATMAKLENQRLRTDRHITKILTSLTLPGSSKFIAHDIQQSWLLGDHVRSLR